MKFIKFFEELELKDLPLVGGKNASLGEMIKNLSSKGVEIPSGFVVTVDGYWSHLEENNLKDKISKLLVDLDKKDLKKFALIGASIRALIVEANFPEDLKKEILIAYEKVQKQYGKESTFAVRSSATAEDLPEASFAGQQDTFLNVSGDLEILNSCKLSFASLFTDRAISYRMDHGFDHMTIALSIGIQKMVRSDLASSGVIFTLDTESGFKDVVFINSSYGLGENIVKGTVNPDEFYVHKQTLKKGFKSVLKKRIGSKKIKMIYATEKGDKTKNIDVEDKLSKSFSINDEEILELARQSLIIEDHYSGLKGKWSPMDIEWAKDGVDGKLYILQARPETVHSLELNKKGKHFIEEYLLENIDDLKNKVLLTGKSVGRKIVSGPARIIKSVDFIDQVQQGDIIVSDITDPDWEPVMKIAAGIVTNRGGRTCHAAIVSRELGIPAVIGTSVATDEIMDGQVVTLDCSGGEVGYVYDGKVPFTVEKTELDKLGKTPVEIMMNIGNPDQAFQFAEIPNDGVGLARLEFIINNSIKIHPMALVHFDNVKDEETIKEIENLTFGYEDKKQFFIDKLSQEAGTIAAAFFPKPVIIRMSDFKSNEYKRLIGGKSFEPEEENPMLGFRGASRYCHEKYREAFALECLAMKKIRDEMGLTNVKLMIPFVRTVQEAKDSINEMAKYGLKQKKNGLEIYMMCEIPSNVILIDEFAKIFDGFSIGSNDLTQTTLAVDRDSELVSDLFDERNSAVKIMLEMAIKGAKRNKKKIGICGQGPSDFPELAQFLVDTGIDSISLNPDSVLKEIKLLGK